MGTLRDALQRIVRRNPKMLTSLVGGYNRYLSRKPGKNPITPIEYLRLNGFSEEEIPQIITDSTK